jgi:hypothetical protein
MNKAVLVAFTFSIFVTSFAVFAETDTGIPGITTIPQTTTPQNTGPILAPFTKKKKKQQAPVTAPVTPPAAVQKQVPGTSDVTTQPVTIDSPAGQPLPPNQPRMKSQVNDVNTTLDPGEQVVDPKDVIGKIDQGNRAVQTINKGDGCAICNLHRETETTDNYTVTGPLSPARVKELMELRKKYESKDSRQESFAQAPKQDINPGNAQTARCAERPGSDSYKVCIYPDDVSPSGFKIENNMGSLVHEWSFEYESRARQDIGFTIADYNNDHWKQSKVTYMMVFPRDYLPAITEKDGKLNVLLPTGELQTFDAKTKKPLSGPLDNSKDYSGKGVSIRIDRIGGDDPRFGTGSASIKSGKTGKTCKVSLKTLWPDQSQGSKLHFAFPGDGDFDKFLRGKCGFGFIEKNDGVTSPIPKPPGRDL